ncbi:MAG TPA: hypothetical protein VFF68_00865 [Anaerolineaceae bacterium]|nr:hypothetical protein [Anaerolineaceae bacterium]
MTQPMPHNLSTVVVAGFEEIIGRADLAELFSAQPALETAPEAGAQGWMGSLGRLEQRYGRCGAQGVAHRAGRASFHFWLRQFGEPLHLTQLDIRLLPARRRLQAGFEAIADSLQAQWGMAVEVAEEEQCWRWRLAGCADSHLEGQVTCCSYLAGFLQEYLAWISGGKFFPAGEIQRSVNGRQVCEVILRKQPLD